MSDLISREALKKALKSNCDLCHDKNTNWCENCCPHNDFEDLIDNASTIEYPFYAEAYQTGFEEAKEKIIHSITEQYKAHNKLVPIWLSIGDIK